jgi:hypothetical protein
VRDDSDERRDAIHALLQEQGPAGVERNAVLVGWAIVSDWMDDEGERWLTKAHSANIAAWHATGLHHEALYGDWPSRDDEDAEPS